MDSDFNSAFDNIVGPEEGSAKASIYTAYNKILSMVQSVQGADKFVGNGIYSINQNSGTIRNLGAVVRGTMPTLLSKEMSSLGLGPGATMMEYIMARGKHVLASKTLAAENIEDITEDTLEDVASKPVNMGPGSMRQIVFNEQKHIMQAKMGALQASSRSTALQLLQGLAYEGHEVTPSNISHLFQNLGIVFQPKIRTKGSASALVSRGRAFARKLLRQEALSQAFGTISDINKFQGMLSGGGLGTVLDSMQAYMSPYDLALAKRTFNRGLLNAKLSSNLIPMMETFRTSAGKQFDDFTDKYRDIIERRYKGSPTVKEFIDSAGGMGGLRNTFIESAWSKFVEPVQFGMMNKAQSPYSSFSGPRMLDPTAIGDVQGLLSSHFGQDTSSFLRGYSGRFLQGAIQARIGTDPHLDKTGLGGQQVRGALMMLDREEAAVAAAMSQGQRLTINQVKGVPVPSNRVASFDRLSTRVKTMLDQLNEGIEDSSNHLMAHYEFHPGDVRTGSAGGYWMTIAPKGTVSIERGQGAGKISQVFIPVSNKEGVFTRLGGAQYQGHVTPISSEVLKNAIFARHDQRLSIVSQALYPISSLRANKLPVNSRQQIAAVGRRRSLDNGFVDLFSANEMVIAHIDAALGRVQSSLSQGDFSGTTRILSSAMGHVFQDIYGFTTHISRLPSQQGMLMRAKVNFQKFFMHNPFNFSDIDFSDMASGLINLNALEDMVGFAGANTVRSLPRDLQVQGEDLYTNLRKNIMGRYKKAYFMSMKGKESRIPIGQQEQIKAIAQMFINDIRYGRTSASGVNALSAEKISQALGLELLPTSTGPAKGGIMSPQAQYLFTPGGMPTVRPIQMFKNVADLPAPGAGANPRAAFNFMKFADEYGKEYQPLLSTDAMRYGRVGFIMGGSLDGKDLTTEQAMDLVGARDQQMIASQGFQEAFGAGADLEDMKLSADISKGVVHVSDANVSIADAEMDLLSGVPLEKLMKKHQSGSLVWRGVLGRILDSAQTEEQAHIVARVLEKYLPPGSAGVDVAGRMVSISFKKPVIYGNVNPMDVASIPDYASVNLGQLGKAIDEINATAGSNPINLIRDVAVRTRSGQMATVRALDLMLGVRLLAEPRPGTGLKTKQLLMGAYSKYILRNNRQASFDVDHLEHWRREGLSVFASDMLYNQMSSDRQALGMYRAREYQSALFAGQGQEGQFIGDASAMASKTYTLDELAATGRGEVGNLTPAEYARVHPESQEFSRVILPRPVDLTPDKDLENKRYTSELFVPKQLPTEEASGFVFPTELQKKLNWVIKSGAALNAPPPEQNLDDIMEGLGVAGPVEDPEAGRKYQNAVRGYYDQLTSELNEKRGLMNSALRSFSITGEGFSRAILKQDVYGLDALNAGEAAVSYDYATKHMGLNLDNHPGVYWDEGRGMSYFHGIVQRSPEIFPRGAMKVYIDPALSSKASIYVNNFDMAQLYGDTDGDTVAILMANAKRLKYKLSQEDRELNKLQFEMSIARRQREYDLESRLEKLGTITNDMMTVGNADILGHLSGLEAGTLQSSAEVARQQYDQHFAQGVMGNLVYPMQDVLGGIAGLEHLDAQTRMNAAVLHNAMGEAREVVLKIAKGGAKAGFGDEMFNSLMLSNLIKRSTSITREKMTLDSGDVINIGIPTEVAKALNMVKDTEEVGAGQYFGAYFPGQGLGKLPEGVGSEFEQRGPMGLAAGFMSLMDKGDSNWYNNFKLLAGSSFDVKRGFSGEGGRNNLLKLNEMIEGLGGWSHVEPGDADIVGRGSMGRNLSEILGSSAMGGTDFDLQMFGRRAPHNPVGEALNVGLSGLGIIQNIESMAKTGMPVDKLGRVWERAQATSGTLKQVLPDALTDNKVRVMTEEQSMPYSADVVMKGRTTNRTNPDRVRMSQDMSEAIAPQVSLNINTNNEGSTFSPDQQAFLQNLKDQM